MAPAFLGQKETAGSWLQEMDGRIHSGNPPQGAPIHIRPTRRIPGARWLICPVSFPLGDAGMGVTSNFQLKASFPLLVFEGKSHVAFVCLKL